MKVTSLDAKPPLRQLYKKSNGVFSCFYNIFQKSLKKTAIVTPLPELDIDIQDSTNFYEKNKPPSHHAIVLKSSSSCLSDINVPSPSPYKQKICKQQPYDISSSAVLTSIVLGAAIPRDSVEKDFSSTLTKTHTHFSPLPILNDVHTHALRLNLQKYKKIYPQFYKKNVNITKNDCDAIEKSWNIIMIGDLNYFKRLKEEKQISSKKNSVSWFYDKFYETFYNYDEINNTHMAKIFKRNMKIQSHALVMIVKNCMKIAKLYSSGKKFDFHKMHKSHDVFGMIYDDYVIISVILLSTFENCLREQWTREMEDAWAKTITILLRDIIPHFTSLSFL